MLFKQFFFFFFNRQTVYLSGFTRRTTRDSKLGWSGLMNSQNRHFGKLLLISLQCLDSSRATDKTQIGLSHNLLWMDLDGKLHFSRSSTYKAVHQQFKGPDSIYFAEDFRQIFIQKTIFQCWQMFQFPNNLFFSKMDSILK